MTDAQSTTVARLLSLNPNADTPDPATAHVGDVWAMPDGPPRAYLNDPHLTGEDEIDPHSWMQIYPPVPVGELRWYRTNHLPAGLRLVLRDGQAVQ